MYGNENQTAPAGAGQYDASAKRAAENICHNRGLKMPEQNFVDRGAATLGADRPVQSELEQQLSDLEVATARLEQLLINAFKRLEPVIQKYPEDKASGLANPIPTRHSFVGHRLQQIEMRINAAASDVATVTERLAV